MSSDNPLAGQTLHQLPTGTLVRTQVTGVGIHIDQTGGDSASASLEPDRPTVATFEATDDYQDLGGDRRRRFRLI